MKLFLAPLALILLTARFSAVEGQIGCDDAPADLQECITREQTNDGNCGGCDPTVPSATDCAALEEWYCDTSTCCPDCENQVADAAECIDDASSLGCVDFEDTLCTGEVGIEQCSEATAAFTDCTIANCPPDADILCDFNIVDADTCGEVQEACQFFNSCCNNACGAEVEFILATCGLGVCSSIDCSAPAPPTDTPPTVAPGQSGQPEFEGCSEAIAAFTDCTIANCPLDADQLCDPNLIDGDTCADVEGACQVFTTCCGGCGAEVEALLATCALGVCSGINCGGAEPQPPVPPPVTTGPPSPPVTTGPPTTEAPAPSPTLPPTEELLECGLDCCSETIAAFTECSVQNCPPDADILCDLNLVDADTCGQVEEACQFFDTCCNSMCGEEVEGLLATCGLGVCSGSGIDCTAPAPPTDTPPTAAPGASGQPEFGGCSEAIAAFTDCTIENCPPDADQICDFNLVDADTCGEVQEACQFFDNCCNGMCGEQVEGLLATCALGVCSEIECSADPGPPTTPPAPTPPTPIDDLLDCGFDCCDEAIAAFTDCTIENCPPDADQICDPNIADADTCAEVEVGCQFFDTCCNSMCGEAVEGILATCGLGVCVNSIDCSAPAPPTATPPTVAPDGPEGAPGFEGCSEASAAFTQCVAQNCPEDADVVCDPNLVDGDTCADVEAACQVFTSCCSGQCGDEVELILATCAFGVCSEIDCGDVAEPQPPVPPTTGPPTTAPPTTSGAVSSLSMLALVASSFMVLALI